MRFQGTITTLLPFVQVMPDMDGTNHMKVATTNEDGSVMVADVPIISPNTIRATLRRNIAIDILEKLGDGSLDYMTIGFITVGGVMEKRTGSQLSPLARHQKVSELKKKNVIASLFGGSVGDMMIESKIITSPGILICKETGFITGIYTEDPAISFIAQGFSWTKRDPAIDDFEIFKKLTPDGITELEQRYIEHKLSKKKDENSDDTPDKEKKKRTHANLGEPVQYVIPGARFWQVIEISYPTEIEVGAIYSALIRFSQRSKLGSFKSKMGDVSLSYTVYDKNGRIIDTIYVNTPECRGSVKFSYDGFLKAYREYIDQLTPEMISVNI